MTPEPEIVDAALKRIEVDSKHPTRKLAAKAVAEYRRPETQQPWVNVVDSGSPLLDKDAVVRSSYPNYAERQEVVHVWWHWLTWWR